VSIENPPPDPASRRDAKAELKAAKAYAKAQRPWYKKKRVIIPGGFILLIVIIAAASGGGTKKDNNTADNPSPPPAASSSNHTTPPPPPPLPPPPPPPASSGPTSTLPIQDGDWRLDSIRIKDDGLGDFGGVGRITYTGANPAGGGNLFTLTVFVGGKDVGVLNGSAEDVKPGSTETVQFISQDKLVGGSYKFAFQNDL
jgi:hypothetical protein